MLYTLVLLRMPRPGTYAMGMRGREGVYLPHLEAYTNPRSKAHFLRHAPAAPIAAFLCCTSLSFSSFVETGPCCISVFGPAMIHIVFVEVCLYFLPLRVVPLSMIAS